MEQAIFYDLFPIYVQYRVCVYIYNVCNHNAICSTPFISKRIFLTRHVALARAKLFINTFVSSLHAGVMRLARAILVYSPLLVPLAPPILRRRNIM